MLLYYLVLLAGAYIVGAIPSGYWVSKYLFHQEVPIVDGQMGTKHVLNNLGFKASLFTFIIDFSKGYFMIWISVNLMPEAYWIQGLVILTVLLGHNYSIFLDFKGGKGIASSFGCFALFPQMLLLMIICHYLANELTKYKTFYGSLPLAILAFTTIDPYRYFGNVPPQIRFIAILVIVMFIIKTYDDPHYISMRKE